MPRYGKSQLYLQPDVLNPHGWIESKYLYYVVLFEEKN